MASPCGTWPMRSCSTSRCWLRLRWRLSCLRSWRLGCGSVPRSRYDVSDSPRGNPPRTADHALGGAAGPLDRARQHRDLSHGRSQTLRGGVRSGLVGLGHEDDELLLVPAGQHVGLAQCGLQAREGARQLGGGELEAHDREQTPVAPPFADQALEDVAGGLPLGQLHGLFNGRVAARLECPFGQSANGVAAVRTLTRGELNRALPARQLLPEPLPWAVMRQVRAEGERLAAAFD